MIPESVRAQLEDWFTQDPPRNNILAAVPEGFRDLMWCPYLNEPAILEWKSAGTDTERPTCPNCSGNFEPATHPFLGHILKPRW